MRSLTKRWKRLFLVVLTAMPLWLPATVKAVEINYFNWGLFGGLTSWSWSGELPAATAPPINNFGCGNVWLPQ